MSRSKKRPEDKIRIVEEILSGKINKHEAARQAGADRKAISDWVQLYEMEGTEGFYSVRNKSYSPEEKEAAVTAYLAGEGSLREILKIYKIHSNSQLRGWIKVCNAHRNFKKQTGGSYMTKGRKTTKQERIAIARECLEGGRNYGEIAEKHDVSYQQRGISRHD